MNLKPTLLVLAAGIGRRYGGLKQLDKVGPSGETIMDYSIYDAIRAGFGKIVFVIQEELLEEFHAVFDSRLKGKVEVDYAFQKINVVPDGMKFPADREKPWGTGHAVLAAKDKIKKPFVVINADDFYGARSYILMRDSLNVSADNHYSMIGYRLKKTLSDFGYVARGVCKTSEDNYLQSVVELTRIEKTETGISYTSKDNEKIELTGNEVVSMNIWGFKPSVFGYLEEHFKAFLVKNSANPEAEFYIPTLVNELLLEQCARVRVFESTDSWFGVTYKADKEDVTHKIRNLVDKGIYPESLW